MPIKHHRKQQIILLHLQIADANNKPALTQTFFCVGTISSYIIEEE